MYILLTGGAGYIGSHTYIELVKAGFKPVILDNFNNAKPEVLERLKTITGQAIEWVKADVRDRAALDAVFARWSFSAVVHFAGWKAVGESVAKPLEYYDNNVVGTLRLLDAMKAANVKNLVFSSSATVYGDPHAVPILEDFPLSATNPYGRSKLMVEDILRDLRVAEPEWNIALLRYFNPVGAHESGLIGEDPQGIPNNLMPFVAQVAVGKRAQLSVFGGDYATPDGTGVRDYIHVVDLAIGHVKALQKLETQPGNITVSLGTGVGYSVLDMVKAFEQASGNPVPYAIVERRAGDIATCYADPSKALAELGWRAEKTLQDMCNDSWRWQSQNPNGFPD
ncbi:UDP-glucose 4-epimerase GalE [Deefgea piscis]|uniref:UDP-glucose 4-epimerase n=2 Tax=Deefgea TaxID=400947 RepID=A0A6M8SY54_9NEIS|nr:UDP-glucose 4-epimerase GalE [Deefgea piscis]QKJ66677.1 UDP-glucose 4-epimerase GalE [Deefgea piscis]QZA81840.1 UDP-glucose 4-epimerase GalE [Deefgea piscis]